MAEHSTNKLIHTIKIGNENYEMTVSITVSHIFVNGLEVSKFFKNAQKEFDQIVF